MFVPEENLLGTENHGFHLIMANFQWERLLMALGAVGAMQAIFERTRKYALQRRAFGKPIACHQVIRHKLAEIAITIEAGRRHLRGPAPPRIGRGRGPGGDDRQAGHPARRI